MKKLETLQVFRGFAAFAVVLYHIGFIAKLRVGDGFANDAFSQGYLGVDFFFVLSGFIIFSAHANDLGRPESCPRYVARRFIRVYPLLLLLTALKFISMLAFGKWVANPAKFDANVIIGSVLLLPLPAGQGHILDVAWTLCHETLFYSVFALGILYGRLFLYWILSAWAAAIILSSLCFWHSLGYLPQFLLQPHNCQFMCGCLAGAVIEKRRFTKAVSLTLIALSIIVGYVNLIKFTGGSHWSVLGSNISWGVAFGMLVLGAANAEFLGAVPTSPRIFVKLGDASYSIYLSHPAILTPLIILSGKFFRSNFAVFQLSLSGFVLVAVTVGITVYQLIEKPLLRSFNAKANMHLLPLAHTREMQA